MNQFTAEGHQQALVMFRRALDIDPAYARAHVGIALTYLQGVYLKLVDDHEAAVAEGIEAAHKAVALDDRDSDAHVCLGLGYMWSHKHDQAVAELRRALDCNPSNAMASFNLGNVLDVSGRPEEGIPHLEAGLKLNPLEPRMHHAMTWLGGAHLNARRYEEALDWLQRAVQRRSDYPLTHLFLAVCLAYLDRIDEAHQSLEKCEKTEPGFTDEFVRWRGYKRDGDNEHMFNGIRKAGGPVRAI